MFRQYAADVLVMPGGGCTKQYNALGEKGVEALKGVTAVKSYADVADALLK